MRVFYLVSPCIDGGIAEAKSRGWTQVARARFVTPDNEDVRLICRFSEFVPIPGGTLMIRGQGYADGEGLAEKHRLEKWIEDMERFEAFVASGLGEWVEP